MKHALPRVALVGAWALLVIAATGGPAYAQKKGGEKCEKDSDCETKACKSGTCDPCPDRYYNCPAPGLCSESDHRSYQSEVDKWCKGPERSCSAENYDNTEVDCGSLKARLEAGNYCAKARETINNKCFNGGDTDHVNAQRQAQDTRDRCNDMIRYKQGLYVCYSCSPSDYKYYSDSVASYCGRQPQQCDDRKDDVKVDCRKISDILANAQSCKAAQAEFVSRCFSGYASAIRLVRQQENEGRIGNCKDVLEYKRYK